MSKSIYNKPKAGKMRIKMRSRIHVVLVRVKEISADAEIFILTSPGYFLSDEISCVKAKALKRCLRQP